MPVLAPTTVRCARRSTHRRRRVYLIGTWGRSLPRSGVKPGTITLVVPAQRLPPESWGFNPALIEGAPARGGLGPAPGTTSLRRSPRSASPKPSLVHQRARRPLQDYLFIYISHDTNPNCRAASPAPQAPLTPRLPRLRDALRRYLPAYAMGRRYAAKLSAYYCSARILSERPFSISRQWRVEIRAPRRDDPTGCRYIANILRSVAGSSACSRRRGLKTQRRRLEATARPPRLSIRLPRWRRARVQCDRVTARSTPPRAIRAVA